ncbi:transposase [Nocardia sp. NBC_01329]|uniref:transposase n=1 Tax=Nocardia sp. NBC_01329 TaxID=2903594 RepID=UPI002E1419E2|nr:transposase [Nocardia sp. NBC_01329]
MVIESPERSIAEVARDLGINSGTLTNWVAAHRKKNMHRLDRKPPVEYEADYDANCSPQPTGDR